MTTDQVLRRLVPSGGGSMPPDPFRPRDARRRTAAGAVVAVLAVMPFVLNPYEINFLSKILVYGLLALSVNLLTGTTGLTVLGQAAYFGVGAYTGALISLHLTMVGPVQLVAAAAGAALVSGLIGLVVARIRGSTFVMISIAVAELAATAATQWKSVTSGSDGLTAAPAVVPFWGGPALRLDGLTFYYVLAMFVLLFAVVSALVRSPFGLSLRAIRDNESRMRASGYPVNRYVWGVYTIAGALAGAAGALYANVTHFVAPSDTGFQTSALALLAVLVGGAGSMWGACVGIGVVLITRDYLSTLIPGKSGHATLLLGVLYVIVVFALPRGIAGVADTVRRRRRRSPRPAQGGVS